MYIELLENKTTVIYIYIYIYIYLYVCVYGDVYSMKYLGKTTDTFQRLKFWLHKTYHHPFYISQNLTQNY